MTAEMYEILSLLARYFFAGLMVVIVFRAWRITVRDNRRAKVLRDWSPETGCVGQLVLGGGGKDPEILPIPREGVLGSSRRADIPIRAKGVLPEHAHVEARQGGLLIRPLGRAQVALGKGEVTGEQLFAQDGDRLTFGDVKALVVLFDPAAGPLVAVDEKGKEPDDAPPTRTAGRHPAKPVGRELAPAASPEPVPKTAARRTAADQDATLRKAKRQLDELIAPKKHSGAKSLRITKPVPKSRDEIDFFDEDAIWREPHAKPAKSKRRN